MKANGKGKGGKRHTKGEHDVGMLGREWKGAQSENVNSVIREDVNGDMHAKRKTPTAQAPSTVRVASCIDSKKAEDNALMRFVARGKGQMEKAPSRVDVSVPPCVIVL